MIMGTKDMKFKLNFINVAKFKKSSRLYSYVESDPVFGP
jgi:hypothetical protein